jgi:hypothetical protein
MRFAVNSNDSVAPANELDAERWDQTDQNLIAAFHAT